jgi:CHAT domain-containing protein/Flp pilus assembly protein TadD
MSWNMSFAREAGEWKIWRNASLEEELAARLVAAESEAEREALLAEDKELLTVALSSALVRVGERARFRFELEQAMTAYRLGLLVAERIANKRVIAASLHNIAMVYRAQGDYERALDAAQKSLKLKEEIGNKASIVITLESIGNVFTEQGNYAAAMETFQRMLAISEELNDKRQIARALSGFGGVYVSQGNTIAALDYFQRTFTLSQEARDNIASIGALQSIGHAQLELGNYSAALETFRKNLALLETVGHKTGVAHAFRDIGRVYIAQGDHTQATKNLERALTLMDEAGFKEGTADILRQLAIVHLLQGEYEHVLARVQRSAEIERQIGSLSRLADSLTFAGQAYQALGRTDEARRAFEEAITLVETLRTQTAGGEQERQRYFEREVSPYYAMVGLLVSENRPEEALVYAERAKGRVLLDVIRGGRANITKAMTAQEREQEKRLAQDIAALNRQILYEGARPQPDRSRTDELKARLEKMRFARADFQTRLYAAHPELRVQRGQAPQFKPVEAAALIADANSALVEYAVTDEATYLFALTKTTGKASVDLKVYKIPVKRKQLSSLVDGFRQTLATRDPEFRKPARELYDLLLKPAAAHLQGKTSIVIVPDDRLWELPFQALMPAANRHLIEDSAISYAPSLTVLREMMAGRGKRKASSQPTAELFALGNPALGKQTVERVKLTLRDERLNPLPQAEREVKTLAELYGAAHSKVYVGAEAREETAKSEASRYRVLHFATHGILNDASPMYSNLVLTQGDAGEDGLLEAWELMNLDLRADLVVLSACETARGRVGAGEGVIGLSWALFVAGSPTTVVSQWKVASASTAQLMLEFHKNLNPAPSRARKAGALRAAAMKLMKTTEYRHPLHWAGFIIVGSDL